LRNYESRRFLLQSDFKEEDRLFVVLDATFNYFWDIAFNTPYT
jgi:hypothetical protein